MSRELRSKTSPKASVILLSYNHEKFLHDALRGFEHQVFKDFEMIIIDDCSSDSSADLLKKWKSTTTLNAKVFSNQVNQGINANLNFALSLAKGDFVCIMSADDWPNPDYLQHMVAVLDSAEPNIAFAFADVIQVDEKGEALPQEKQYVKNLSTVSTRSPHLFMKLLSGNLIDAPAVMMRRDYMLAAGGYDESLMFEDYDMWLRLSFEFDAVYIPKTLVNYRVHGNSMSRSPELFERRKRSELSTLNKWVNISPKLDEIIAKHLASTFYELKQSGMQKLAKTVSQSVQTMAFRSKIYFNFRLIVLRSDKFIVEVIKLIKILLGIHKRQRS